MLLLIYMCAHMHARTRTHTDTHTHSFFFATTKVLDEKSILNLIQSPASSPEHPLAQTRRVNGHILFSYFLFSSLMWLLWHCALNGNSSCDEPLLRLKPEDECDGDTGPRPKQAALWPAEAPPPSSPSVMFVTSATQPARKLENMQHAKCLAVSLENLEMRSYSDYWGQTARILFRK